MEHVSKKNGTSVRASVVGVQCLSGRKDAGVLRLDLKTQGRALRLFV